jgi:membrane fusion protein, copper/silver efflux system
MADSSKVVEKKNSIVREGVIDLKAIDKNNDSHVYQDMMDYNVISDKPGKCPLCGMTLKKISIEKAKEILLKSGFKVKE